MHLTFSFTHASRVQQSRPSRRQLLGMLLFFLLASCIFSCFVYGLPIWRPYQNRACERVETTLQAATPFASGVRLQLIVPETGEELRCQWAAQEAVSHLDLLNTPGACIPCIRARSGELEPDFMGPLPPFVRLLMTGLLMLALALIAAQTAKCFVWLQRHRRPFVYAIVSPTILSVLACTVVFDKPAVVLLHLLLVAAFGSVIWFLLAPRVPDDAPPHTLLAWLRTARRLA